MPEAPVTKVAVKGGEKATGVCYRMTHPNFFGP